jgi:hypothetical protein
MKEIRRNGKVWKAERLASKRGDNISTEDVRNQWLNCMSQNFSVKNVYHGRGHHS